MEKIAVTGHRPNKLGGYAAYDKFNKIKNHMHHIIQTNFSDATLISGGALGIDQLWIEVGILLELPVIVALPFLDYDSKWPLSSRQKYEKLLAQCQEVRYISEPGYAGWKMQKRNEWMVDNANAVVAYWNGSSGGTANCVAYAKKKGREVLIFNPKVI